MVTNRQKRVIPVIIKNGGNVSKAMVDVGYSKNTAHTPAKLTESKGFKEEMEALGLTESLIAESLVADIKSKPKKRIAELTLGSEILGMKKREDKPSSHSTTNIIIISPNGSQSN